MQQNYRPVRIPPLGVNIWHRNVNGTRLNILLMCRPYVIPGFLLPVQSFFMQLLELNFLYDCGIYADLRIVLALRVDTPELRLDTHGVLVHFPANSLLVVCFLGILEPGSGIFLIFP